MITFRFVAASLVIAISATAVSAQALRPNALLAGGASPAAQKITMAKEKIGRDPKHHQAYNDLAMALTQRARETADPLYYLQAEEAVKASLAIAPDNFEALKVRTWALLGQHKFAAALELATTLNKKTPTTSWSTGC